MAKGRNASWKLSPMFLIVLTIYSLSSASAKPERRDGQVTDDKNNEKFHENARSYDPSGRNSLALVDDEQSEKKEKKVAHRLIGGHMRFRTRASSIRDRKDENVNDETKDDDEDVAIWDDGLIIASAGNGKEKKTRRDDDDDEKKTLSQQVKEGKYGLIQNEIHSTTPERPGVLSYLSNPEIPRDNARNYGGLDEDEIWLAENHVLVLRGGKFPDRDNEQRIDTPDGEDWSPIDDYRAPKRQVKIPPRPSIPPPFPVQLTDGGPIRVIGANETHANEESSRIDENASSYRGYLPGEGPFFAISKNRAERTKDLTSRENTTEKHVHAEPNGKIKSGQIPQQRNDGIIGPFYPAIPPGAVIVPPPSNQTDYDDDDQSMYYPPPYSFYYKQDNSTPVPPGPLVPGIILPPPPDFFSGMEEKKTTGKISSTKYPKRPGTTSSPRSRPTYYTSRKTSLKTYEETSDDNSAVKVTTAKSRVASFTMKPLSGIKYKTTTLRTTDKPIYARRKNASFVEEATVATIDNANDRDNAAIYTPKSSSPKNSITEASTTLKSKIRWSPDVISNSVPLVTFYSGSTTSSIDDKVDATPISVDNIITAGKHRSSPHQASYYFYEEAKDDVGLVTTPNPMSYYRATTEAPLSENDDRTKLRQQQEKREDGKEWPYEAEIAPTAATLRDYRGDSLESDEKTSYRYRQSESLPSTNSVISSRAKAQRMLDVSSPSYHEGTTERARSYYATTRPRSFASEPKIRYDYERDAVPKPIYQYSYESADYSKQRQREDYYEPETQSQRAYYDDSRQSAPRTEPFQEWRNERDENNEYDYAEAETPSVRATEPEPENNRYRNRLPVTYRATQKPIIVTTMNPQNAYYTRQDDQLLDDVTREYFTNFGKKLRGESPPNTTPIYEKTNVVTGRPDYADSYGSNDYEEARRTTGFETPNVRVQYGDNSENSYSLEGDTDVNYRKPLPPINPESEWLPGYDDRKQSSDLPLRDYRQRQQGINDEYAPSNLPAQRFSSVRNYDGQRSNEQNDNPSTNFVTLNEDDRTIYARPFSLKDDLVVNYRDPRPPVNPDAEYIDPTIARSNNNDDNASYFAYRLPGDGGHFYFLTPQATSQRDNGDAGYVYQRPRGSRLLRQRRRGPRNS